MEQTQKKTWADVEQMVRRSFPVDQFDAVMLLLKGVKKEPEEARVAYLLNILPLTFGKIGALRCLLPMTFDITRNDVEEKVRQDFPPEKFADAMAILDVIKKDAEDLRAHFQLGILNKSQGNLELLRQNVETCDKRSVSQPVPKVARKHVERIVRRDFPVEKFAEVMAALDEYRKRSQGFEIDRVQLDILKLAGGKLEAIPELVKEDPRDVISRAEYPSYRWDTCRLPAEDQKKIFAKDWQQYLAWANSK
jgi:hypothetical protein